jgi:hypothetical protein
MRSDGLGQLEIGSGNGPDNDARSQNRQIPNHLRHGAGLKLLAARPHLGRRCRFRRSFATQ